MFGLARAPPSDHLLVDIAHGLIEQIVCTELSEQQTEEQQTVLAIMALRDTVDSLEKQQPDLTERLEKRLDRQADSFQSAAVEMARACGKRVLADSSILKPRAGIGEAFSG